MATALRKSTCLRSAAREAHAGGRIGWSTLASCAVLVLVLGLSACGTLPNGRAWGQDATLTPGWERVQQALVNAALDPLIWGPAAGAALLQVGGLDEQLSEWAIDHTPIFGSQHRAKYSHATLVAALACYGTALATPSGDEAAVWIPAKLKGLAVDVSADVLTSATTGVLKDVVGRARPTGDNHASFPSGGASGVAVNIMLASRHLDSLAMSDTGRTAARIGLGTVDALGAWARVEAAAHYPSDVLAGMALGHFLGAFIHDAFLGLDGSTDLDAFVGDGGLRLQLGFGF